MTDIPNTEYVTINKKGIFVGGKLAVRYHGEIIAKADVVKESFAAIQAMNPEITELHVGAFETKGEDLKSGKPSGKFGPYAWCRVKFLNGNMGDWVFCSFPYCSASFCAYDCAYNCSSNIRRYSAMQAAVLKEKKLLASIQNVR